MNIKIQRIIDEIQKVIIGKEEVIKCLLISLLCEGHILLEGNPGVGKTRLALCLAKTVEGKVNRIQFTPDILPSDIVGYSIIDNTHTQFIYREGIVFCNFLLADEINRASPRVQSSLLEAMEEKQVTVDGKVRELPEHFMVIATQNTIEQQGTYPLPEAQLDRFFMKLKLSYPSEEEWAIILRQSQRKDIMIELEKVLTLKEVDELKEKIKEVYVSEPIERYIIKIAKAIEESKMIQLGISPRGTIALLKAAKGYAFMEDREYVIPDDIHKVFNSVVSHRIILSREAELQELKPEDILLNILQMVEVPIVEV